MKKLIIVVALMLSASVFAQNKMLSSKQLMNGNLYPQATMRNVQFVGNTDQIAYVQDTVLYMGNPGKAKARLTLGALNKVLASSGEQSLKRFPSCKVISDKELQFSANGKLLLYNMAKRTLVVMAKYPEGEVSNVDMEDNHYQSAYTQNNNLYVQNGKKVFSIESPDQDIVYGQSVHRNEFGIEKGTFWSPKGNFLAFYRMDQSMVTDYPLVNTTARIAREQPFKYPMAGMKSHEVTVGIYDASQGTVLYLDTRRDESVAERENYLTNISWDPNEEFLYIAKINREQNHMWLERYYVSDGEFDTVLFEETNPRYVEPCDPMVFLPNHADQFLWYSMRDGYKHLYLYNTDGQLLRQVTKGNYEVEGIIGFDAKCENLFIYANKDEATGRAAYRVNLLSGEMTLLTPDKGTHTVVINNKGTMVIDQYNSVDNPGCGQVLNIKGKVLATLYQRENPLADCPASRWVPSRLPMVSQTFTIA